MSNFDMNFSYSVDAILSKIIENKKNHQANYDEAMINYKRVLEQELQDMLADLKAGKEINPELRIRKPQNFLTDYDNAIRMLQLTTKVEIELSCSDFSKLVLNNWDWKRNFELNTLIYSNENVGIGTSDPSGRLVVNDSFKC